MIDFTETDLEFIADCLFQRLNDLVDRSQQVPDIGWEGYVEEEKQNALERRDAISLILRMLPQDDPDLEDLMDLLKRSYPKAASALSVAAFEVKAIVDLIKVETRNRRLTRPPAMPVAGFSFSPEHRSGRRFTLRMSNTPEKAHLTLRPCV
jgi:hypothetical protein